MTALDEWAFQFAVRPAPGGDALTPKDAEALMLAAVEWAEARDYGIGGGPSPGVGGEWRFRFGLCATQDEQLITEQEARQLFEFVRRWCHARGWALDGEFRPFTEEERAPFPLPPEEHRGAAPGATDTTADVAASTNNEDARIRLVSIISDLLTKWEAGLDWRRTAGDPPFGSEGELDVPLVSEDPHTRSLAAASFFVEAFADASWHGFRDLNGIPWDEAVAILRETRARLDARLPIEDPRVLGYLSSGCGCSPFGWIPAQLSRMGLWRW